MQSRVTEALNLEKARISRFRLAGGLALGVICLVAGGAMARTALRSASADRAFARMGPPKPYFESAVNLTLAPQAAPVSRSSRVVNLEPVVILGDAARAQKSARPPSLVGGTSRSSSE